MDTDNPNVEEHLGVGNPGLSAPTPEPRDPPVEPPGEVDDPPVDDPPADDDDPMAEHWARYMEADAQIYQREQAVKGAEDVIKWANSIKDQAKQNPLAALQALGVDQQALMNAIVGPEFGQQQPKEQEPAYVKELRRQNEELMNKISGLEENYQQTNQQRQAQEYKNHIAQQLETLEGHDLIKAAGHRAVEDIYALALDASTKGKPLTLTQAAKIVEDFYTKEAEQYIGALRKTPTFGSLFKEVGENGKPANNPPPEPSAPTEPEGAYVGRAPTLTEQMAAEPPSGVDPDKMSDEQHRRYAMQYAMAIAEKKRRELKKG